MSWTVQIGTGYPLEVSSPEGVAAAVAGVLMGSGLDARMARTYGQNVRDAILLNENERRTDWSTKPLDWVQARPQGEPVHIPGPPGCRNGLEFSATAIPAAETAAAGA